MDIANISNWLIGPQIATRYCVDTSAYKMLCQGRTAISQTTRRKLAAHNRGHMIVQSRAGKCYITLLSNQILVLNARLSSSRSRKRVRFGIYFAILISLSTSSTASTFVAVANNLQSKVAMALVSLSSVAAIFDDVVMLMASAMKMPMICIFFSFFKEPGMALPLCTPG